ncbi:MAG: hypothetical protein WCK73_07930 [Deltaproteobacteria bacterium]
MTEDRKAQLVAALVVHSRDALIVGGVVLIAVGAYEIHRAAGHIVLGMLLAAIGLRGVLRG